MNDDIMITRTVNSASVDEYCRAHNLILVSIESHNDLIEAYNKLKAERNELKAECDKLKKEIDGLKEKQSAHDYPFDPNAVEMGQL